MPGDSAAQSRHIPSSTTCILIESVRIFFSHELHINMHCLCMSKNMGKECILTQNGRQQLSTSMRNRMG